MRLLAIAVSAVLAAGGSPDRALAVAEGERPTSQVERLARIKSVVAAFNRHDIPACVAHLSAAARWSRGDGSTLQGREALAARLRDFFAAFPDASLTPGQILTPETDVAVVEWVLEGTHLGPLRLPDRPAPVPATGRRVRFVGAEIIGFDASGAIEWNEARIDAAALLTQLDLLPSATPRPADIRALAERYTAAWCSQKPARVAAFFAEDGSLRVNGGTPSVGRAAITKVAVGFMTAFPDMTLLFDGLYVEKDRAVYKWTLVGTNSGPGGKGRRVRISGFEVWRVGADGLVAESRGYFDSAAYVRQLEHGVDEAP